MIYRRKAGAMIVHAIREKQAITVCGKVMPLRQAATWEDYCMSPCIGCKAIVHPDSAEAQGL